VTAAQLAELRGSPKRCEEPVFPRRRTGAPGQNTPCGDSKWWGRAVSASFAGRQRDVLQPR